MIEIKINQKLPKNDDYKEDLKKWEYNEEAAEGGAEFSDMTDPTGLDVVRKFPCEEREDYNFRKKSARIRPYIQQVLNKYVGGYNRTPPKRSDNPFYSDVTGTGIDIDSFFKLSAWEALVKGYTFVLADYFEGREILRSIEPEDVPYHECDEMGGITEAIVIMDDGIAIYFNEADMITMEVSKDYVVKSIIQQKPHGFTNIPLKKIYPMMGAEAFIDPLVDASVKILNLESLLETEIYDNIFTRWALSGDLRDFGSEEEKERTKLTMGTKRLMTLPTGTLLTRLAGDASQGDLIMKAISEVERNLYRAAGFSSNSYSLTNNQESGLSRLVALEDFFLNLSILTGCIENAERYLVGLLFPEDTPVSYSRTFTDKNKNEALIELRDILALDLPQEIKDAEIAKFAADFYGIENIRTEE